MGWILGIYTKKGLLWLDGLCMLISIYCLGTDPQLTHWHLLIANSPLVVNGIVLTLLSPSFHAHRYSDFHTLHHDLKTFCPSELFPPIPKKIYFGRSQTRTVAQQRMKELEGYLQVMPVSQITKENFLPCREGGAFIPGYR